MREDLGVWDFLRSREETFGHVVKDGASVGGVADGVVQGWWHARLTSIVAIVVSATKNKTISIKSNVLFTSTHLIYSFIPLLFVCVYTVCICV